MCVGNPQNPNDSDACFTRVERTCTWNHSNPNFNDNVEKIDWIDCGGMGCSGGGGWGEEMTNDSIPLNFVVTCGESNQTFVENFLSSMRNLNNGIVSNQDYGCFPKNILKAIQQKQGTTKLNVCYQDTTKGASGTYNVATKKWVTFQIMCMI